MPIARNAVALDLGVGVALSDRANLSVNYNGQFGSALSDQGVKANLSIRF
jgi:outer membrane autotransporter protein